MPVLTDLKRSGQAAEIALEPERRFQLRRSLERDNAPTALVRSLSAIIFYSLLVLLPLTAIPYGTVEPWWVSLFECGVFMIAVLGIVQAFIADDFKLHDLKLFAPLLALTLFVLFQSLMILPGRAQEISNVAISTDPYGTRMFALKLFALIVFGFLLLRHSSNERRLRRLIYVVIAIGVASALFGILRKSFQQDAGFLLPGLPNNNRGFAQFINRNHFAFLIEMTFGLTLGVMIGEAGRRRKLIVFAAIAILLWASLVASGSRGGILATFCQVLFLGVLLDPVRHFLKHSKTDRTRLQNLLGGVALRVLLIVCLVAAFAYGVVWIGGESVVTNFELAAPNFSQQGQDQRENTSRKQIWASTWDAFKANPIAGVGAAGYWIGIRKYHDATGEYTPQEAHNDYLELLASGGIIGTALVIWFLAVFLSRARRSLKSSHWFPRAASLGALTGLFGVAIHSFVDFGLHITSNALIACALLVIAVQQPAEIVSESPNA